MFIDLMLNVVVAVRRRLVQRAHHILPGQTLHASREQTRTVLRLGCVWCAEIVVVGVERVLRGEWRRSVAVE